MRSAHKDCRDGFTLIEMIIVMAIISVLMGFGIGMFKKLTSVGKATQARNTLVDLIQQVKTASMTRPAALVVKPATETEPAEVYGLVFRPVQMSSFEPPEGGEDATVEAVPGLAYKSGRAEGDWRLDPFPAGHVGGCLVSETGCLVDFDNYEEYDLVEGISISLWVYPTENRATTLIRKGDSYGLRLKRGSAGPVVEAFLNLSDSGDVGPDATGTKQNFAVEDHELRMNRWNGIQFHYDRAAVSISLDCYGQGAVERLRKEEKRPVVPDRRKNLTIGDSNSWFVGRMDDLKVSGIHAGDHRILPDDVFIVGERRTIRFVDGRLDSDRHRGPETIVLTYQGVENPITIGVLGNILLK